MASVEPTFPSKTKKPKSRRRGKTQSQPDVLNDQTKEQIVSMAGNAKNTAIDGQFTRSETVNHKNNLNGKKVRFGDTSEGKTHETVKEVRDIIPDGVDEVNDSDRPSIMDGNIIDLSGIKGLPNGKGEVLDHAGRDIEKSVDQTEPAKEDITVEKKYAPFSTHVIVTDNGYTVDTTAMIQEMGAIIQHTKYRVTPLCERIVQTIKNTLSEPAKTDQALSSQIKPLINQAGSALNECTASLKDLGADTHSTPIPDENITAALKELAQTVIDSITTSRHLLKQLPHAEYELGRSWNLLSDPLFRTIASVGLLSHSVTDLFTSILNTIWLPQTLRSGMFTYGLCPLKNSFILEGVLRGLLNTEERAVAGLERVWLAKPLRSVLGVFGFERVVEAFRLGTVQRALEIEG
ncbi:hypothetical protein BDV18DRAFT_164500 [Aspergillus unguis]